MKIEISKIKISDRIRTDAGDLDELANDIKENGLITPIAVTQDYELLAGWRRLNACKKLGWAEIEANVMTVSDALDKLKIEISENENRKDFTFSEKMRWAKLLKEEYRKIAEENQKRGTSGENSPEVGRVDERVGLDVGIGKRDTFNHAEYIVQHATPEMIKALDENQLSINAAYQALKRENERVNSLNAMLQDLSDKDSDKIESLEIENDNLRERVEANEKSMKNSDNSELYKKLSDTKLALHDMEEQKVAAEMLADKKTREIQTVIRRNEELQAEVNESKKPRNETLDKMVAGINIISGYVTNLGDIDMTNWSDEDIETAKSALSDLVSDVNKINKMVKSVKAA